MKAGVSAKEPSDARRSRQLGLGAVLLAGAVGRQSGLAPPGGRGRGFRRRRDRCAGRGLRPEPGHRLAPPHHAGGPRPRGATVRPAVWTSGPAARRHRALGRLRRGAARRAPGPGERGPPDRRDRGSRGAARGSLTYVDEVAPRSCRRAGPVSTVACTRPRPARCCSRSPPRQKLSRCCRGLPAFTDSTMTAPRGARRRARRHPGPRLRDLRGRVASRPRGVRAGARPQRSSLAVLSIWGPRERVPEQTFARLGAMALQAARQVAGRARGPRRQLAGRPSGRTPARPSHSDGDRRTSHNSCDSPTRGVTARHGCVLRTG